MSKVIGLSCFAYQCLLMFYPKDLRRRFGAEMADVFRDMLQEAVSRRGPLGAASHCGLALWEVLTVALPPRLQSSALMAGTLSLLVSSVLFLAILGSVN
jgi:hypothetical protein